MLTNDQNHFMLSDGAYDVVKKLVQIVLPAFSALYFGLAAVWGLPGSEQVVGTIAVLTTFLGLTIGISSREYHNSGAAYDGVVVVTNPEDGPKNFSLEFEGDIDKLDQKSDIRFKVDGPITEMEVVPKRRLSPLRARRK